MLGLGHAVRDRFHHEPVHRLAGVRDHRRRSSAPACSACWWRRWWRRSSAAPGCARRCREPAHALMRHALVFGGSGQIGAPLLERLQRRRLARALRCRGSRAPTSPGWHWLQRRPASSVAGLPRAGGCDLQLRAAGSCSRAGMRHRASMRRAWSRSARPASRPSAARPIDERTRCRAAPARRRGSACSRPPPHATRRAATMLRPTLVYGAGRDAHPDPHRRSWRSAGAASCCRATRDGLRQPVHVRRPGRRRHSPRATRPPRMAAATPCPAARRWRIARWCARVLAALEPPPRLIEVPIAVVQRWRCSARAARGRVGGSRRAAVAAHAQDLVFDIAPARRDFGYAPRAVPAGARMFESRETRRSTRRSSAGRAAYRSSAVPSARFRQRAQRDHSTPPSTIAPPSHSRGPGRSPQNAMPSTTASTGTSSSHGVTCATGWRCTST